MPNPEVVIPQLEGTVGSLAGGKQAISDWVQSCRALMKSGANKSKTTWNFTAMPDIDEAGSAAVGTSFAAGATLYALLVGTNSADASEDLLAVCEDADGTIAAFSSADTLAANTNKIVIRIPAAAVDGTEDLTGYIFRPGITFSTFMSFVADGEDGTNPATDDIRAWALYTTA